MAIRPGADFSATDVRVYRPYRDEIPWELLSSEDELLPEFADDSLLRIAKFEDEVVGVYAIQPESALSFRLQVLVVAGAFRRRGVGRWLLGHAIGLAESKGGRELIADGNKGRAFLAAAGFEVRGKDLLLAFTPE